jgi:hypothetical protein
MNTPWPKLGRSVIETFFTSLRKRPSLGRNLQVPGSDFFPQRSHGGPKLTLVSTLVSGDRIAPFVFRNYKLPYRTRSNYKGKNQSRIVLFERHCHATEKSEAIACARRCRSSRLTRWWTKKNNRKKWRAEEEERHEGPLTQKIGQQSWRLHNFVCLRNGGARLSWCLCAA